MSQLYSRPLSEKWLVEKFLHSCLSFKDNNFGDIVLKVLKEEIIIGSVPQQHSTLSDIKFRHPDYSSDDSRIKLRKEIVDELILKDRLPDDNNISLGVGGAKPSEVKKNSEAVIVIGLPASGKSSISNKFPKKWVRI
ncbi:hypothetical protein ACKC5O_19695 [Aeromonas schubertii]|uniref:hypothetical protein n=1 Tax=Aeromonas schubertii TaxID=652 RepID=UPI0038B4D8A7